MAFDGLTLFGVASVTVMLVAYALEERAPIWVLVFGLGCLSSGFYALLQGAWPFVVAEVIFSLVALRRWQKRRRPKRAISP